MCLVVIKRSVVLERMTEEAQLEYNPAILRLRYLEYIFKYMYLVISHY